jgi:hypothetical protein
VPAERGIDGDLRGGAGHGVGDVEVAVADQLPVVPHEDVPRVDVTATGEVQQHVVRQRRGAVLARRRVDQPPDVLDVGRRQARLHDG